MSEEEVDYSQYGVQVGKASYDRKTFNSFKIEEGSNVYRILPPIAPPGSEPPETWNVGVAVHWGYKNSKGKMRPFVCPEKKDRKTKMIIHRCAECDRLADLQRVYDDKLAQFTKELGKEKAEKKLKHYKEHLFTFNRGFKIYVNAYNEKNQIGALGMSMTHFKLLQIEADKFSKKGWDITAMHQGVWFDFFREGSKTFKVEVVRNDDDTMKSAKVPIEVAKQLKNSVRDLNKLFTVLTDEQITKLANSEANPEVVDAIFGSGETEESEGGGDQTAAASAARAQQALSGKPAAEPKAAPKQEPKPAPKQEAAPEPEEEREPMDPGSEEDEEPLPLNTKSVAAPAKSEPEDTEAEEPLPKARPVNSLPAGKSIATMDSDAFRALVQKK